MYMQDDFKSLCCLQILPKSHLAGRIHHHLVGEQAGADLERVGYLTKALGGEVPVEMEAGDALFFHCNVLHTSAQNHSPYRRWAFLVAYNRADNDPVITHHHPSYTPLHKVWFLHIFIKKCYATDIEHLVASKDEQEHFNSDKA